jgi:thymidine kinase
MAFSGSISIIFGPMFSGKTGEMFRVVRRYTVAKKKCMVVKYSKDTRYAVEEASTHDHFKMPATPAIRLADVREEALLCDVIGIDEGQFFPDVVEFSEEMANLGKTIIVACLDGSFERKPFGRVVELLALAESVTKLTSVCMVCQANAAFSKRITKDTALEVIGGADMYIAVCRGCYFADQASPAPSPTNANTLDLASLTLAPSSTATPLAPIMSTSTGSSSPVHGHTRLDFDCASPSPAVALFTGNDRSSPLA